MRVEDIMTKDVSFCTPRTNAAAAAEIMWTRNCGSIPVVEDGAGLVGMVTDRDLFIGLGTSNRPAADLPVGDVMNKDVSLCVPGDDVREALKTMAQRGLHRLPVVDQDGALVGILSLHDIVLRAEKDGIPNEVLKTMKAICRGHNQHAAGA
jgi:CBS domain-containing protein